jgi:hypothetical protein
VPYDTFITNSQKIVFETELKVNYYVALLDQLLRAEGKKPPYCMSETSRFAIGLPYSIDFSIFQNAFDRILPLNPILTVERCQRLCLDYASIYTGFHRLSCQDPEFKMAKKQSFDQFLEPSTNLSFDTNVPIRYALADYLLRTRNRQPPYSDEEMSEQLEIMELKTTKLWHFPFPNMYHDPVFDKDEFLYCMHLHIIKGRPMVLQSSETTEDAGNNTC